MPIRWSYLIWRQSFAGRPLMAAHCSQSRPCKICLMLGSRTYKRKSSLLGCRCFPCSHGHGSDDSHWHPTAIMSASRWRQCNPNARIAYATSLASKARYRGVRIRKTYLVTSASYTRLCACLLRVLALSPTCFECMFPNHWHCDAQTPHCYQPW